MTDLDSFCFSISLRFSWWQWHAQTRQAEDLLRKVLMIASKADCKQSSQMFFDTPVIFDG